ncbi:unnamed protein product [Calypogeia fissa]
MFMRLESLYWSCSQEENHSLHTEEQSLVNWPQHLNLPTGASYQNLWLPKSLPDSSCGSIVWQHCACRKNQATAPLIADVVQSLLPLVPVEMGGALRSDFNLKSSAESSRSSSKRQQQQDILNGSESFTFAPEPRVEFDLPPNISSAASSGEIHAAMV